MSACQSFFFFSPWHEVDQEGLCFQPSGKLDFLSFKTKWQDTSSSAQWDLVSSLRILLTIFRLRGDRMSGFVKVHTVNNVTLRDTAGLRRETERERGFCWIDNYQDQTGDSMLKTRGKSGA